jgi:hypothetical protein
VRQLCPCHLKRNDAQVWDRLIAMATDDDPKVRSTVLHVLCDGSPRSREQEVIAALPRMQRDNDEGLRRRARKVLAQYRRTGTVNVLGAPFAHAETFEEIQERHAAFVATFNTTPP